ncbi:MAG: hypothetical protein P0S96_07900 [Simkaniaceae bacterium]|nr:hypothetical protein [Candidatus Sacchlamyda saccharinae]
MSTTTSTSPLASWVQPSHIATDVKQYLKEETKDSLEGVINIFEWMAHLGWNKDFAEKATGQLEPIKQTLAIPGFVSALGNMSDKWHILNHTDEPDAAVNFSKSVALTTLNLCESAMCGDSWGVYSLKEGMKAAKTGFWASAGFLDAVSFFKELNKAGYLQKKVEHVSSSAVKNVVQHKIQLCYLNVLKATTTIAMAAIALTSLLFASLAHGFLFTPVVFLSLASAWLVLTYATHFYGNMIDRWEAALPLGKA